MLELLTVLAFFGYIYYLRNYADLRTKAEKEEAALAEGILMFQNQKLDEAYRYFDKRIQDKPKSSIAYLYRGLCKEALGNSQDALQDIQMAVSLDDTFFKIQLELGRLLFENDNFSLALTALNKAVTLGENRHPEAFRWRGQTYLKLHQDEEAWEDFATEKQIAAEQAKNGGLPKVEVKAPFLDRRLIASMTLVLFTSAVVVSAIKNAESVHLPYLVAVFSAISIGFAEPRKGWLLAIMQSLLVLSAYLLFTKAPESSAQKELESFSLYGSIILTFAASFLGGFLKRAFSMK
ncbi:tetratricopeptide repeat protein [Dyadobacter luticola]|uniref:Uncharacterized protein n=1 Tax=Dyadobacter luticola TaxID=1979387 RepID=A0A5R9L4A3_9BACT|nr:hypothetical protein [Dyadobacter luticola]TLV03105.1 hypothetical protein FEN17_05695 [Dyadobacter luticola]